MLFMAITTTQTLWHHRYEHISMRGVESARWGHQSHHNTSGVDVHVTWADLLPSLRRVVLASWGVTRKLEHCCLCTVAVYFNLYTFLDIDTEVIMCFILENSSATLQLKNCDMNKAILSQRERISVHLLEIVSNTNPPRFMDHLLLFMCHF